jgi:hypothetical protein
MDWEKMYSVDEEDSGVDLDTVMGSSSDKDEVENDLKKIDLS